MTWSWRQYGTDWTSLGTEVLVGRKVAEVWADNSKEGSRMVHSLCRTRIFSLLPNPGPRRSTSYCCCKGGGTELEDAESQIVGNPSRRPSLSCDSMIVCQNNNNYVVLSGSESESKLSSPYGLSRWSSSCNWTRACPELVPDARLPSRRRAWLLTLLTLSLVILVTLLCSLLFIYMTYSPRTDFPPHANATTFSPLSPSPSESETTSPGRTTKLDLKRVSRLSWNLLNRRSSQGKPSESPGAGGGLIFPAHSVQRSQRSSCRIQKYEQVIRREGCEEVRILNAKCMGQCLRVWIPGVFGSFPTCRPSRSTWKTVTLACGSAGQQKVRVERVRRCSCMEPEAPAPPPTTAATPL